MPPKGRIYLIDGSSYVYRAFFAIRDLKTSRGVPTNAVYGFTTMLLKVLRDLAPEYLAVVMDAKGPTFRHLAYEHYKANRPEMPEALQPQIPWIKDVIAALGIPLFEQEGFEADDLMGSLARAWASRGFEIILVSGDKDLLQLLSPTVTMMDTLHDRVYDEGAVKERYGVAPDRLPDVFGLMGDSSDNIPGVPGIGEKRAAELIRRFGSLEETLARAGEITQKKLRESLEKHSEQARLSKQLAIIDTQVPVEDCLEGLRHGPPVRERLRAIFKELEFHRLLQEWTEPQTQEPTCFQSAASAGDLRSLAASIRAAGRMTLQLDVSSPEQMQGQLVGAAWAFGSGEPHYTPLGDGGEGQTALEALRLLLEAPEIAKTGHDLKSAVVTLERQGVRLRGPLEDTMVASYVLNPSRRNHSLEDLALELLDRKLSPRRPEAPGPSAGSWSCERVAAVVALSRVLVPRLEQGGLARLFRDVEMPLIPVLARMEMNGIRLDAGRLVKLSAEMEEEMRVLEAEIHQLGEGPFNINSPQQLAEVLFERLKLPVVKKSKTGYSTDMEVLAELSRGHPLPGKVLAYRSLAKLKSTYVDALPALVRPDTGRIHTSFNQTVTATGRLSSSEPNLQNIPVRGERGQRIREAFVPQEGQWFLSADYSQVELRILAHLSRDPILLAAFHRGEDVHTHTACEIFGVSPEGVTPQMRREAKVINFGIIYGMTSFGLARELGVAAKVAQAYIEGYFQRYRGVRDYLDRVLEEARNRGYVETLSGRRRYLPEIASRNVAARKFAERTAINTPIQGTAADMIKKAMIRIHHRLDQEGLSARMLLQVHDELLFEVPEGERDALEALVREEMAGAEPLDVPLTVQTGWGRSWAEAH
jgi:DNA polymerase-1